MQRVGGCCEPIGRCGWMTVPRVDVLNALVVTRGIRLTPLPVRALLEAAESLWSNLQGASGWYRE